MRRLVLSMVLSLGTSTQAATIQPTRFDDPLPDGCLATDCSLREAVIQANATSATDTIVLASGDYVLQRLCNNDTPLCGDLDVSSGLEIVGAGSALTAIRNTTQPVAHPVDTFESRVLDVQSALLSLDGVRIAGGVGHQAFFTSVPGGCLHAQGSSLLLLDVEVSDCYSATLGGAIHLSATQAWFESVTISDSNGGAGGGLSVSAGSTVLGSKVRIQNNKALSGGGISASTGSNLVRLGDGSAIARNVAVQGVSDHSGGGVMVLQGGALTLDSNDARASEWLRIEDNEAAANGGGVGIRATGALEISQTRIIGNVALGNGGGAHARGALHIHDCEVARNVAEGDGGAISFPADGDTGSRVEGVSLHANLARGNGGGIASSAARVALENVSSHANRALGVGGGFYLAAPPLRFRFNTSLGDVGASDSALHATTSVDALANVLAGKCTGSGVIANLGYNRRTPAATGCPGSVVFPVQMGLVFSDWGGAYRVVGFGPVSALANVVPASAWPPLDDARDYVRVGPAFDAGAFERDGVAP